MYKIILASNSPRRKELLEQIGVKFIIIPSNKEEITTKTKPADIVKELAIMKAKEIAERVEETSIIIGADTMVAIGDEILGKPKDYEDAKRMITMLQGKEHQVYTGVGIIIKDKDSTEIKERIINFVEESKVKVSELSTEQIENYISTKEPYDKAGAYAIQGLFAAHIESIHGDYNNIVGLPIAKIYRSLLNENIDLLSMN